MERIETVLYFFEDAFVEVTQLEVMFVDPEHWDPFKRPDLSDWHRFGINPPAWEPNKESFVVVVNPDDFLKATEHMDKEQFLASLMWWKARTLIRMKHHCRIADMEGNINVDERIVEDLTNEEMTQYQNPN